MKYILFFILLSLSSCALLKTKSQIQKTSIIAPKETLSNYERANSYYKKKHYKQAFDWYQKAAKQGVGQAQFYLGLIYLKGKGIAKNYKQAFDWFQKAALQGHVEAQTKLGAIYYTGQGVPKNYKQAFHWFQKAAIQGYALAQLNLGLMYEYGLGVPKNLTHAYALVNLAIPSGFQAAIKLKNKFSNIMSLNQIAKAQKLSIQMAQKIINNKNTSKSFNLK